MQAIYEQKARQQVQRLADIPEFARAERMRRFLHYVVDRSLARDTAALRERQIGIEVFDRPHDWDPKLDNIVRSEARRLRSKLDAYAARRDPHETVRITIPTGGYGAEFTPLQPEEQLDGEVEGSAAAAVRHPDSRLLLLTVAGVSIVLILSAFIFLRNRPTRFVDAEDQYTIEPFSTEIGQQFTPDIAPDGKRIAFVWNGGSGDFQIYTKTVGGSNLQQITHGPLPNVHPAWSPDGRSIAYIRQGKAENYLLVQELSSHRERMIRRFQFVYSTWTSSNPFSECQSLAWTPSGDRILMTASLGATSGTGLVAISTSTGEERVLTTPVGDDQDCFARLAPDGQRIAFVRMISHAVGFLYTMEIDGGHLTQITHDPLDLRGVDWLPDGRHIVFAAKLRGAYQLRVIALGGSESIALPSATASASNPVVAHDGSYIAFVEGQENWNIWRISLENSHLGAPQRFLASTGQNHSPSYSPNGKTIAFVSDRSGNPEIWTCDADGKQLRQLTHFGGPWLGTIRWSPDGKNIVFDARPQGHSAVYVMDLERNAMQVLATPPFEVRRPSWSRDGKSLYYDSTTKGRPQVWKHDLASGQNQLVAPAGSVAAIEDLSGQRLLFVEADYRRVWVANTDGTAAHVLDDVTPQPTLDWAPATNGLLYLVSSSRGADVFSYSFREGKPRKLGSLPQMLADGTPSFAISPDQRTLLYATIDQRISEIKLRRALVSAPAH